MDPSSIGVDGSNQKNKQHFIWNFILCLSALYFEAQAADTHHENNINSEQ